MDELEQFKDQVKRNQARRKLEKQQSSPSALKPKDTLIILHQEEVETLETVLYDALEYYGKSLSSNHKRNILNMLKLIQTD